MRRISWIIEIFVFIDLIVERDASGTWSLWTTCSVTCGRGLRVRTLVWDDTTPLNLRANTYELQACDNIVKVCVIAGADNLAVLLERKELVQAKPPPEPVTARIRVSDSSGGKQNLDIEIADKVPDEALKTGMPVKVQVNRLSGGGQTKIVEGLVIKRYGWSSWSPWTICPINQCSAVQIRTRRCLHNVMTITKIRCEGARSEKRMCVPQPQICT